MMILIHVIGDIRRPVAYPGHHHAYPPLIQAHNVRPSCGIRPRWRRSCWHYQHHSDH